MQYCVTHQAMLVYSKVTIRMPGVTYLGFQTIRVSTHTFLTHSTAQHSLAGKLLLHFLPHIACRAPWASHQQPSHGLTPAQNTACI